MKREESLHRERRDSIQVSRTTASPSIPFRQDRPPVMSGLTSGPKRRLLFDNEDDDTYDIRSERSPILDRQLEEEIRGVHFEEPRITSTGMVMRPTPSTTLVSSFEPPRLPVTGILEYGGGTVPPHKPGMSTSSGATPQRVTSGGGGGGGGGDDSSSDHSRHMEGRPPGRGRGPPGGGEGEPPHNGNGTGNGDENGDGEESNTSSISSHRGPPGP